MNHVSKISGSRSSLKVLCGHLIFALVIASWGSCAGGEAVEIIEPFRKAEKSQARDVHRRTINILRIIGFLPSSVYSLRSSLFVSSCAKYGKLTVGLPEACAQGEQHYA